MIKIGVSHITDSEYSIGSKLKIITFKLNITDTVNMRVPQNITIVR